MILEGVESYIRNVETTLYLLKVNEQIIPLTLNEREYDNSYLTSNYFPINYLEELLQRKYPRLHWLQKPLVHTLGLFLKGVKINKVAIVNNWLLTTNIYPSLTLEEVKALTHFVKKRFPDHLILFRSLNTRKCQQLASDLAGEQYKMVGARSVFIFDPAEQSSFPKKALYHHRRDKRLIEKEGYEVVYNEQLTVDELKVALNLYRRVYIGRHTKYSPEYTQRFLECAMKTNFFDLIGVKKGGELLGVMGCTERNGTLIVPFFGFDREKGGPNHIYRILTNLAIDEAMKRGVVLNDGSGGDKAKRERGMRAFPEYVALYSAHLPLYRRIFWSLADRARKISPSQSYRT